MIVEAVMLQVKNDMETDFENAFKKASSNVPTLCPNGPAM